MHSGARRARERDGDAQQAIDACREALKESTRERVPLQWAMTAEQSRQCAYEPRRARERDGDAQEGGRRLSRGAHCVRPRAIALLLASGAKKSRPGLGPDCRAASAGGCVVWRVTPPPCSKLTNRVKPPQPVRYAFCTEVPTHSYFERGWYDRRHSTPGHRGEEDQRGPQYGLV